jgi:Ca2+-binding EF-hand superfamily protein
VAEALRAFDGDGDGLISLDELYHGAHASIADKRKTRS